MILAGKNAVDICHRFARLPSSLMKCETTNLVLTLALGILLLLSVIFTVQTVLRTREFGSINAQLTFARGSIIQQQALFQDCLEYSKTHPDLTRIIQPYEAKPAAH